MVQPPEHLNNFRAVGSPFWHWLYLAMIEIVPLTPCLGRGRRAGASGELSRQLSFPSRTGSRYETARTVEHEMIQVMNEENFPEV